jgi:hypothetical protein
LKRKNIILILSSLPSVPFLTSARRLWRQLKEELSRPLSLFSAVNLLIDKLERELNRSKLNQKRNELVPALREKNERLGNVNACMLALGRPSLILLSQFSLP